MYDVYTMGSLEIEQKIHLEARQQFKLLARLEQANLLEIPGENFNKLIIETENSSLFNKFYRLEKIIRYRRFARTDISSSFCQLREDSVPDRSSLDVESILMNKERIVHLIQELGAEKFKRYFLYPDSELTIEEIAKQCDLKVPEAQQIFNLVDECSILSDSYHPSSLGSRHTICYSKIASIERHSGDLVIGYLSPSYARGRYSINYERFEELQSKGGFNRTEIREAKQLFKKLELINTRKDIMNQILQSVIEKQAPYLESGDENSILPFSQKQLAQKIGRAPSSISRAIYGKSVETPWGIEISLKHFFPRPKKFKRELVRQLLESEEGLFSDEAIKIRLQQKFDVTISRRSIANLRKELRPPTTHGKGKEPVEEIRKRNDPDSN